MDVVRSAAVGTRRPARNDNLISLGLWSAAYAGRLKEGLRQIIEPLNYISVHVSGLGRWVGKNFSIGDAKLRGFALVFLPGFRGGSHVAHQYFMHEIYARQG